jgi:hypothetical protein
VARLGAPPELSGWEGIVYGAYHELGRDFNGSPLMSEKVAWMNENGVVHPDDRAELLGLWRQMETEDAEVREERTEREKKKTAK